MNRSALATFSLATAIAVMTLGYANPSFAEPKNCVDDDPRPSCKGDEDPTETAAVYKAALTMGGFIFEEEFVTLSKRGNSYHSQATLVMTRDDDRGNTDAWDRVFSTCSELITEFVERVEAGNNWTINISGSKFEGSVSNNPDSDILIRFRDVVAIGVNGLLDVDIDFNLIGKISLNGGPVIDFLPKEDGDISVFQLKRFNFFGSGNRGGGCRSGVSFFLENNVSFLEIKRIDPDSD